VAAVATAVVGCGGAAFAARARAAKDFRCGEDQVVVTALGGSTYGADGCGSSNVYECTVSGTGGGSGNYVCVQQIHSTSWIRAGAE
jgi:hypothetical protein